MKHLRPKDYLMLWHEAIRGRKATDIASTYLKLLSLVKHKHVVVWADNCSGQNKSWFLYTALIRYINTKQHLETVTLKYLEVGHTFMAADGIHGEIGKYVKRLKKVENFQDFVNICGKGSNNCHTACMGIDDFYCISRSNKARSTGRDQQQIPILEDLVEVKFVKGSSNIFVKKSFSEEDGTEVNFLQQKFMKSRALYTLPIPLTTCRGITEKKRNDIVSALKGVCEEKRIFWEDICIDNSAVDLSNGRDNGEAEH